MRLLRALALFLLLGACGEMAPQRVLGSCIISPSHGGPYQVLESRRGILTVRETSSGNSKTLPNDFSWTESSCELLNKSAL